MGDNFGRRQTWTAVKKAIHTSLPVHLPFHLHHQYHNDPLIMIFETFHHYSHYHKEQLSLSNNLSHLLVDVEIKIG